jgi:putative xylitol transport system permease protein
MSDKKDEGAVGADAARPANAKKKAGRLEGLLAEYGIILVFFAFCIILAFANPYFLKTKNLINVLRQVSINGLLSIGMTFVVLTGGIDLSVGSILAFAGVVGGSMVSSAFAQRGFVYPVWTAVAAAVGVCALLGGLNGLLVSRLKVPAFVATLGMLSMARGFTFIYTDGMPIPNIDASFLFIGQGVVFGIPFPVIILAVVFLLAWITLYKTRFGRYVYAVGGNEKSAKVSGVNTKLVIFSVYVISGILAALGGLILTARTTAGLPQAGTSYELDAIAAVVIGGTSLSGGQGDLVGTLFGALIIGVINNGLDLLGVSSYYQQVIKGAIIIGAVLLDSIRKRKD